MPSIAQNPTKAKPSKSQCQLSAIPCQRLGLLGMPFRFDKPINHFIWFSYANRNCHWHSILTAAKLICRQGHGAKSCGFNSKPLEGHHNANCHIKVGVAGLSNKLRKRRVHLIEPEIESISFVETSWLLFANYVRTFLVAIQAKIYIFLLTVFIRKHCLLYYILICEKKPINAIELYFCHPTF